MWRKLCTVVRSVFKSKPSRMSEENHYVKPKKKKSLSAAHLNELTREELVKKVMQLEAYNTQLKNILRKKSEEPDETEVVPKKRKCNFQSSAKRHVLLKFFYFGWDTQGYVTQDETTNTIEYHLFRALEKCCLIERRDNSNYQKCGRTDKGVSAFSQVISIDLRSSLKNPGPDNCKDELPYLSLINRLLPSNIRCYAWAHVDSAVGARFDCTSRTYLYYFPRGDLNIMRMKEGAKQLIGDHDFRNLCKMDVRNAVTKFRRLITHADIIPCSDSEENDYKMYKLVITASGFLWHQIRCIMAVLLHIGKGKESPDIIKELLDVEKNPRKPQYQMSDYTPLTLFDCSYDNADVKWNTSKDDLVCTLKSLHKEWTFASIKETMIKEVIDELLKMKGQEHLSLQTDAILVPREFKTYKPLLTRAMCESLDERIDYLVEKGALVLQEESESDKKIQTQC